MDRKDIRRILRSLLSGLKVPEQTKENVRKRVFENKGLSESGPVFAETDNLPVSCNLNKGGFHNGAIYKENRKRPRAK